MNDSKRISQLDPYTGPNNPVGSIPITIMGVTYKITPQQLFILSANILAAIQGASAPSAGNPFATLADIMGGSSYRKFVLWATGDSLSIPVSAGVTPTRVTINEVDIYPELSQYTQAAPGADIVISATVLFDDQSRILITS